MMKIKITLEREDIEDIIGKHIKKEVPVPTAGKNVFIVERYGKWEIEIEDKETEDATL